jgi:hypothetical protein
LRQNAVEYWKKKRIILPVDYKESKDSRNDTPMILANQNLVTLQMKIDKGLKTISKNIKNITEVIEIDDDEANIVNAEEAEPMAEAVDSEQAVSHSGFTICGFEFKFIKLFIYIFSGSKCDQLC